MQVRGEAQVNTTDMVRAVNSIPSYIAKCTLFVVLAPSVYHEDANKYICSKATWQSRGWCRLELTIYALLQKKGIEEVGAIFIHHRGFIQESVPLQWLYTLPGKGDFTVKSDRFVAERMVAAVAAMRLKWLSQSGPAFDFRFFQAVNRYISPRVRLEKDLDKWLRKYQFGYATDVGIEDGWGPPHFAAIEGNLDILKQLGDLGVLVDAPAGGAATAVMAPRGLTPLMAAARYIPEGDVNMDVCNVLLELWASPETRNTEGQSVLHFAAGSPGGVDILRQLLHARADVQQRGANETPLMAASLTNATTNCSRRENLKVMLEYGARWDTQCGPLDATPWTFMGTSGAEDVKMFLDFKADPNAQLPPSAVREATRQALRAHVGSSVVGTLAEHGTGLTTLMVAAWLGNWETIEVLLAARANPNLETENGRRAIDWLTEYGVHCGHTYKLLETAMRLPDA